MRTLLGCMVGMVLVACGSQVVDFPEPPTSTVRAIEAGTDGSLDATHDSKGDVASDSMMLPEIASEVGSTTDTGSASDTGSTSDTGSLDVGSGDDGFASDSGSVSDTGSATDGGSGSDVEEDTGTEDDGGSCGQHHCKQVCDLDELCNECTHCKHGCGF